MWTAEDRGERAKAVESRLLVQAGELRDLKRDVLSPIRAQLLAAWDEELLKGPKDAVFRRLQTEPRNADGHVMLAGGPRLQGDPGSWDTFTRDDGARFGFALTFREEKRHLTLLTYSYTFCFSPDQRPPLRPVRWDLDLSGSHSQDGLRSHLHLADEVRVPAPQLSPAELIDLLVYRLGRPRGVTHS